MKVLQNSLIDVNEDATHCVPLHPLYANTGMSVDQLYAELMVKEDLAAIQRTDLTNSDDRYRNVQSPSDLFYKEDNPVKNVFMLGQPGFGKTTFCLHLLKLWCAAKKILIKSRLTLWQIGMIVFDFVFYISLRHVDRSRSSVVDMICEEVFERDDGNKDIIRHVLSYQKYRCLIVVDGLDEWAVSPEAQKILQRQGLPNTKGLSVNCTVLFASRHWKIDLLKPKYCKNDIVVEISGLSKKGVDTIIQNILVNFFKLDLESAEFEVKVEKLKSQMLNSTFESSMRIPMLVTFAVFLGFDEKLDQKSKTWLALDQLELLIQRAFESEQIDIEILKRLDITEASIVENPMVKQKKYLSQFIPVLYKLGKIAFNDLVSETPNLVFNVDALVEALGERELEFALKVGVVSQMRAPGRFHTPRVSIEFFHKSMQEALVALYIVCDRSSAFTCLCEYCCTVEKVMEMSNVLHYIAGISPEICCKFSKHIVNVASSDQGILNERTCIDFIKVDGRSFMLYSMLIDCYREMTHTLSLTSDFVPLIQYHVADVVFAIDDTDDKVKMTVGMMRSCTDSILSFSMALIVNTPRSAGPVLQILPQCSHLTTLQVMYHFTTPDPELVSVIPTLPHLQRIEYFMTLLLMRKVVM